MKKGLHSRLMWIGLVIVFAFFNFYFTCNEEDTDACDETKWIETKEPLVYIKFTLKQFSIENKYNSHAASSAGIYVSTTKYYCPDKKSTSFSQDKGFKPNECLPEYLDQGFYLDQPYQFKFGNDLDYLELVYDIRLYFENGPLEEEYKWENTLTVYYPDLIYDYNLNSYYISIIIDDWSKK